MQRVLFTIHFEHGIAESKLALPHDLAKDT